MDTRRRFIQKTIALLGAAISQTGCGEPTIIRKKRAMSSKATVYRCLNGRPEDNMNKVIEMMGGIDSLFGPEDIIIIKPNVQWWNQGAPNIAAVNQFVSLIMERPGFKGEVIIAENNHRGPEPWKYAGWQKNFVRNSDVAGIQNYNEFSEFLKNKYGKRVTICHWINIKSGGKRVYSPEDGPGYVLCDGSGGVPLLSMDNGLVNEDRREVIMSYPVFISDSGTIIDFKNGVWERGAYTDQPVRFVNCAALNHHSSYCGITSAVKNLLGVVDLSGGPDPNNDGIVTEKYYNFHSFPFNKWSPGPASGMLGAEIGMFFDTIRLPDLNLTTAEWVGLTSRTEPPVAHTRAVLASTDPVALDYHGAKYLVYPNSRLAVHNPDNESGPLNSYLGACAKRSGLVVDEALVSIESYDLAKMQLEKSDELVKRSNITWGSDIKSLVKYLTYRFT